MILRGRQAPDRAGSSPGSVSGLAGSIFSSEMLRVLSEARDKS